MSSMLTTEDNPHDPRIEFTPWYLWDLEHGYNTCRYLAAIAHAAEDVPEAIRDAQIEAAIDEIILNHAGGLYKKLPLDDAA